MECPVDGCRRSGRVVKNKVYKCSLCYKGKPPGRPFNERMHSSDDETTLNRLAQKTNRPDGILGCWLNTINSKDSYGLIKIDGKDYRIHVIAHKIQNPDDPTSELKPFVLHKCGQHRCWNPFHLRAGTNKENVLDAQMHGTFPKAKCGTESGYDSHRRKNEKTCPFCKKAHSLSVKRRKNKIKND